MKSTGPIAVDVFAGCGGLSEGFTQAGFDVVAQVEMDDAACETLRLRHMYHELKERNRDDLYFHLLSGHYDRDDILGRPEFGVMEELIEHRVIKAEMGEDDSLVSDRIRRALRKHGATRCHVLLGAPPCQPYSLAGRARDVFRKHTDSRHDLYQHYLDLIEELAPDCFVYENVPGLVSARVGGRRVVERLVNDFAALMPGYTLIGMENGVKGCIVNSADYGVPQERRRVFLIGVRSTTVSREVREDLRYVFEREKDSHLTVRDAISDLPSLQPEQGEDGWLGRYTALGSEPLTRYQSQMRENSPGVIHHRARSHMESDLDRYRYLVRQAEINNRTSTLKDLLEEEPELLPQHTHLDKFVDRFKVQRWDRPASTITAHIAKDGHYYIHPDIEQCRSFTVREAARVQSFPDNYFFAGPRTLQFKQVGNAVPPRMAKGIAEIIMDSMDSW